MYISFLLSMYASKVHRRWQLDEQVNEPLSDSVAVEVRCHEVKVP